MISPAPLSIVLDLLYPTSQLSSQLQLELVLLFVYSCARKRTQRCVIARRVNPYSDALDHVGLHPFRLFQVHSWLFRSPNTRRLVYQVKLY